MTHRRICTGWAGVHTEPRVLSEGDEPVTHGMCPDCECAMWVQGGAERKKAVSFNQAQEPHDTIESS